MNQVFLLVEKYSCHRQYTNYCH